ncbi:hypothetical protein ATK17_0649 [Branchiibius hedensis]|uniref:Homeodomain-like domain-containing protein n=1 Tax=Branchiibius hedensis TaxID=672460 RepID=A0A2Y8ZNK2_9MICO|nr:hypothetical protein [Branchiibius hedensis]PWJ24557.1 hypothetical protein ATK17_0649 [Branchiibius hedensis]SSA33374.1 hypothetical protein SAMN04489750_0649 [Branchiibius hedensis]
MSTTEADVRAVAATFHHARAHHTERKEHLAATVRNAYADGATEVDLAAWAGVDRMTIRRWLGKKK